MSRYTTVEENSKGDNEREQPIAFIFPPLVVVLRNRETFVALSREYIKQHNLKNIIREVYVLHIKAW